VGVPRAMAAVLAGVALLLGLLLGVAFG
jgi:hypothetical protein